MRRQDGRGYIDRDVQERPREGSIATKEEINGVQDTFGAHEQHMPLLEQKLQTLG